MMRAWKHTHTRYLCVCVVCVGFEERIIERVKEQRDRDEREKMEEQDGSRKDLKELREKLVQLQGDMSDREVRDRAGRDRIATASRPHYHRLTLAWQHPRLSLYNHNK